MRRFVLWVFLFVLFVGCGGDDVKTYKISNTAGSSEIGIRTTSRYAGAIDSITWGGKEYVDNHDHGRGLQSASSFNGLGECYNPTEAGSLVDRGSYSSSSVLMAISAEGSVLNTKTQMAFWIPPGYAASCGQARNTLSLSNHILSKMVRIGHPISPHIIEFLVTFDVPNSYSSGTFEVLTAYMPPEFSRFLTYKPSTGELSTLTHEPGEQPLPIIFSSTDGYAMGIYSPDLHSYGRWKFDLTDVVKWNVVFRTDDVRAGKYSFKCYVIVGSLEHVRDSLTQLIPP